MRTFILPFFCASVSLAAATHAQAQSTIYFPLDLNPGVKGPPLSAAVQVGDILYLSGQVGILPGQMKLVPGGFKAEARQAMENIGAILAARHLSYDDMFKCTVFLSDIANWPAFNEIYAGYFKRERLPARSAFAVKALAIDASVEVECMANTKH
jgi:reactive intermediate/imine deaminase